MQQNRMEQWLPCVIKEGRLIGCYGAFWGGIVPGAIDDVEEDAGGIFLRAADVLEIEARLFVCLHRRVAAYGFEELFPDVGSMFGEGGGIVYQSGEGEIVFLCACGGVEDEAVGDDVVLRRGRAVFLGELPRLAPRPFFKALVA